MDSSIVVCGRIRMSNAAFAAASQKKLALQQVAHDEDTGTLIASPYAPTVQSFLSRNEGELEAFTADETPWVLHEYHPPTQAWTFSTPITKDRWASLISGGHFPQHVFSALASLKDVEGVDPCFVLDPSSEQPTTVWSVDRGAIQPVNPDAIPPDAMQSLEKGDLHRALERATQALNTRSDQAKKAKRASAKAKAKTAAKGKAAKAKAKAAKSKTAKPKSATASRSKAKKAAPKKSKSVAKGAGKKVAAKRSTAKRASKAR